MTTASDGKEYNITFYSLYMILAIGFRVRSKRGTQFKIWANKNLKEYMVKGFLMDDEIDTLNRLVVIFLESAELRAKNRIDITMDFWRENVDKILDFQDKKILTQAGSISKIEMEKKVLEIYKSFDERRRKFEALQADKEDLEELKKT